MRRSVWGLASLFLATTAQAQAFEGTVAMTVSSGTASEIKYYLKGEKMAATMAVQGMEGRMVMDIAAQKATILMPMSPQMAAAMPGVKGIKYVMDLKQMAGDDKNTATLKALGTSQTIAGYKCDDFEFTNGKDVTRICMTRELGTFALPMGGMGRGRAAASPDWVKALGGKPGFPLKVWGPDGKVAMEVTKVDKGSVPESMFAIPDGYQDMSSMMNGMRGGGR